MANAEIAVVKMLTGINTFITVNLAASFTPNLILSIGIGSKKVNDSMGFKAQPLFGAATGLDGADTRGIGPGSVNNASTMDTAKDAGSGIPSQQNASSIGIQAEYHVSGFLSGGLIIQSKRSTVRIVQMACLDVQNAHVGWFRSPGTTGLSAVTGVPFQPNLVMLYSHGGKVDGFQVGNNYMFGASDGNNEFCTSATDEDGVVTSNSFMYHLSSGCVNILNENTGASVAQASLNTFNVSGFVLDWSAVDPELIINYIAIKEPAAAVLSNYVHDTGLGLQTVEGADFRPKFVLETSLDVTGVNVLTNGYNFSFGYATNEFGDACMYNHSLDGVGTSETRRFLGSGMLTEDRTQDKHIISRSVFRSFTDNGHIQEWLVTSGATARIGGAIWIGEYSPLAQSTTNPLKQSIIRGIQ
jgi:hypothetical protein